MLTPHYSRLMLRVLCSVFFGFVMLGIAFTSTLQAQLPTAQADIVSYSTKDIITSQGTNQYKVPTMQQQILWAEVMSEMLKFNFLTAHQKALALGYQVTDFTDLPSQKKYYILEKSSSGANFWGKYMVNPSPSRPSLVIQSPHPVFDFNTGLQGAYIFKEVGAVLFCVAGTHRCNDTSASPCAGITTVCSPDQSSRPFRRSDQAHSTDGMFQITTNVAIAHLINPIIIHVHGFDKGAGEPDVILSNGTQKTPTAPLIDYALRVKQQLQVVDAALTFKVAHIDLDWTMLTGTTNMQGRLLNNSTDPCTKSATTPTGRFVHIEQAKIGLRDSPTNWNKLTQAIAASIPAIVQPPQLSVTPSSLNLAPSAGVLPTVNVISNTSWTATSNQPWLQLTTPSGTGNGQVSGSVQSNTSTTARQATITISAGGLQRIVMVSQAGAAIELSVTPSSLNLAPSAGVLPTVNVSANTSWTATSNQSWLQLTTPSGTGNGLVNGSIQSTTSTTARQAIITITAGALQRTVMVSQAGAAIELSITPSSLNLVAGAGVLPTVNVSANTSWTAMSSQPWLQLTTPSGTGNGLVNGSIQSNASTSARLATITISAGALQRIVMVSQAGAAIELSVTPSVLNLTPSAGVLSTVNVISNTSWTATSNQPWLQLTTPSGTGNGPVSGSIQSNTSTTARQAIITISSGALQRSIMVSQAGAVAVLTIAQSRISIPSSGQRSVAIAVHSNLVWTASASQPWITLKRNSGSNTDSLTFDAAANPTSNIRSATIILVGLSLTQSLLVEQASTLSMTDIKSITQYDNMIIPNPVNDDITLRHTVHQPGSVLLRVINALGITVLQKSLFYQERGRYDERITAHYIPSGLYTMLIHSSDGIVGVPLLIIR